MNPPSECWFLGNLVGDRIFFQPLVVNLGRRCLLWFSMKFLMVGDLLQDGKMAALIIHL